LLVGCLPIDCLAVGCLAVANLYHLLLIGGWLPSRRQPVSSVDDWRLAA